MSRKLASVQQVEWIKPIPDADQIELLGVLGWQVVVRKDLDYRPGDMVVYFEIDSVLPNLPAFEEMQRGKPYSARAARLKSVRFRGQISQGYVRHIADVLPDEVYECGDDVTELIGVTKYEPPAPTDTAALAGHWIPGIPKTDETRIQSEPKLIAALTGQPYVITVKLDGQSATYGLDADGEFWACSRNFRLKPPNGNYWAMVEKYPGLRHLASLGLYVQGELCGPGIQKNRLGLTEPDLFVFDIYDGNRAEYLTYDAMASVCQMFGLKTAPLFERGVKFNYSAEQLLHLAEGHYDSGKDREGLVIRSRDRKISFKAISNRFLLGGGD